MFDSWICFSTNCFSTSPCILWERYAYQPNTLTLNLITYYLENNHLSRIVIVENCHWHILLFVPSLLPSSSQATCTTRVYCFFLKRWKYIWRRGCEAKMLFKLFFYIFSFFSFSLSVIKYWSCLSTYKEKKYNIHVTWYQTHILIALLTSVKNNWYLN